MDARGTDERSTAASEGAAPPRPPREARAESPEEARVASDEEARAGSPEDARPEASSPTRELAREVLIHGPIARSDLGRRLGLSPASLTRLSRPLLDEGFFVETADRGPGGVGRPVRPLDVRVDAQWHVGVKLTGDQAFGVATDLRATVLAEVVVDLPGHGVGQVVDAVSEVVTRLADAANVDGTGADAAGADGTGAPAASADGAGTPDTSRLGTGTPDTSRLGTGTPGTSSLGTPGTLGDRPPAAVGVSVGGQVRGSRVVTRAPFLGWRDVDLGGALERRLGLPVVVANDVVALTEAEHWFGRGRGLDHVAVLTIGAGVGYGLVVHGRQVITVDTGLGFGAHVPLADPGDPTPATAPSCPDGHHGCASALLSIPAIRASVAAGLGREVSYADVLSLAGEGDPVARAVVDRAGTALGRLIATVANLTMVGTVVLAGEGVGLVPLARRRVDEAIAEHRDPDASPVDVLVGTPDFGAWARGAAAVAIQSRVGHIA